MYVTHFLVSSLKSSNVTQLASIANSLIILKHFLCHILPGMLIKQKTSEQLYVMENNSNPLVQVYLSNEHAILCVVYKKGEYMRW